MRLRATLTALATAGLTVVLAGPAGAADLNCSDFATQQQAQPCSTPTAATRTT